MKKEHEDTNLITINNPKILKINKKNYRLNPFFKSNINNCSKNLYVSEGDSVELENEITKNDDGITLTLQEISPYYFRVLNKEYSSVINSISARSGVTIIIPKFIADDQHIILKCDYTNRNIQNVAQELKTIVTGIGINFNRTHFVSIPMESRELKKNVAIFRDRIMNMLDGKLQLANYLRSYETLHLTVCMLDLGTPEKLKYGSDTVQQICSKHVTECMRDGPLLLDLIGVDVMGDDQTNATVIYAKVNEVNNSNRLQTLCDAIVTDLKTYGMIFPAKDDTHVLLHMTVLKTPPKLNDSIQRKTFDATPLLEEFKDFRFGGVLVKSIHLSYLNEIDPQTHYYRCLLSVEFFK